MKCMSQSVSEEIATVNIAINQEPFVIKQAHEISSPKGQLDDVRKKLALVREYSKQMCKGTKNPKKKKSKSKKQLNVHTVPQRKISEESDIYPEHFNEKHFNVPYKEVRVYSPLRKLKERGRKFTESDDSSWFDLTDCSTAAAPIFCSGDAEIATRMYDQEEIIRMQELYEKKISDLINVIEDLKQENSNLINHVGNCEKELSL